MMELIDCRWTACNLTCFKLIDIFAEQLIDKLIAWFLRHRCGKIVDQFHSFLCNLQRISCFRIQKLSCLVIPQLLPGKTWPSNTPSPHRTRNTIERTIIPSNTSLLLSHKPRRPQERATTPPWSLLELDPTAGIELPRAGNHKLTRSDTIPGKAGSSSCHPESLRSKFPSAGWLAGGVVAGEMRQLRRLLMARLFPRAGGKPNLSQMEAPAKISAIGSSCQTQELKPEVLFGSFKTTVENVYR